VCLYEILCRPLCKSHLLVYIILVAIFKYTRNKICIHCFFDSSYSFYINNITHHAQELCTRATCVGFATHEYLMFSFFSIKFLWYRHIFRFIHSIGLTKKRRQPSKEGPYYTCKYISGRGFCVYYNCLFFSFYNLRDP